LSNDVTPVLGVGGVGGGGAAQAVRIHRVQTDIELRRRRGRGSPSCKTRCPSQTPAAAGRRIRLVRRPPASESGGGGDIASEEELPDGTGSKATVRMRFGIWNLRPVGDFSLLPLRFFDRARSEPFDLVLRFHFATAFEYSVPIVQPSNIVPTGILCVRIRCLQRTDYRRAVFTSSGNCDHFCQCSFL
jgi:hypothetical protein